MGNPAGVRRDFDALEKRRFEAIRLVEQGVNQLNRLEAPLLQCVEIASNSSGIAHTRLDALSLDKYRYIMRDSIGPLRRVRLLTVQEGWQKSASLRHGAVKDRSERKPDASRAMAVFD